MIIVIIVEDIRKIELSKMDGSCSQQSYFGFHRTQQHFRWRGRKICHLKTIRCHSFPTCTSKYNQKFFTFFQVRRLLTFKLSRVFRRILRRPDAMVFTKGSFIILHTKFQPQLPIDLVCNTFLCAFTIL